MNAGDRSGIREVPRNIEAEQIVLGSAILKPAETVPIIVESLKADHFYDRRHRAIYRAIVDLFDQGAPCDVSSLANRLDETGKIDEAGGRLYLSGLLDHVVTTATLDYYAGVVRKKATLRAMIDAGGRITELGYNEAAETSEVLDKAESLLFSISGDDTVTPYYRLRDFLGEHFAQIEQIHHNPDLHALAGLSTGFKRLDEMTTGLRDSDLIVLAGRPGTGKTSLGIKFARHAAVKHDKTVGFFSLEMTKEQLLERMLSAEARVSLQKIRGGYVPDNRWRDLTAASARLHKAEIIIDDAPSASVLEIRAKARRMASQYGLDLIVVDYLQLIDAGIRTDMREQEVAYIARSLKKLAREINVPVIAISQLSRKPEARRDKRPRLADLRESGAIEQDADMVLFVYRDDYYEGQSDEDTDTFGFKSERQQEEATRAKLNPGEAEIIVAKQRNGPTGAVKVAWLKAFTTFAPLDLSPE